MCHLFMNGAAALLWSAATAFAANPAGNYSVANANTGDGGNWAGVWTYAGGRETGNEIRK